MNKALVLLAFSLVLVTGSASAQAPRMDRLLYGVAYYDKYMPTDRLEQGVRMMKEAGINVVRIAESTWSTVEPQDGVFDFTHINRVLRANRDPAPRSRFGRPTGV